MEQPAAAVRREAVLEEWLLCFYIFSAAGWLWEVLLTAFTTGGWVNRGLLHGPWLPVYGAGGVLLTALLPRPRRLRASPFLLGALLGGAVEYGTALILENWYRRRWWDYTGWPGSVQGRVCLASVAAFAIAGWLASRLGPTLVRHLAGLRAHTRTLLCRAVSLVFAMDWALSLLYPNTGAGITSPL